MKPPSRLRDISRQAKVWTREISARRAVPAQRPEESNPVFLLAAITLGIPALLAVPLIGMNPSIQEGAFTNVVTFVVVAAFVVAAVFEIKRLAEQPSDDNHH
jgi:hypothetical protein